MARTSTSSGRASHSVSHPGKPLLQDHLPKQSRDGGAESVAQTGPAPGLSPDVAAPDESKARGDETRSPAEIGTRRHLEGAEQGPM
jgi:hypothetical protein